METLHKPSALPTITPVVHSPQSSKTISAQPAKERFLRLPEVMSRTGLGKSSIYGLQAAGQFPASVRIGPRCVAWRESGIDAWIQARIELQAEQEQAK